MEYEAVIGLETHVQLKTKSKMWCGCANAFGAPPNTNVCPVCLGLPGVLPVANEEALRLTVLTGLLLNCKIPRFAKFDRKSYFYPDMPKNYQITQYDKPSTANGWVEFEFDGETRLKSPNGFPMVRITRAHLEEDVGKSFHFERNSGVDFNRAGVPLMEIVSEPDITSADMAYEYLNALKEILMQGGVSDCDMEKGMVRCDVNVSVRPVGSKELGAKIEIKNMNSFSGVRRALEYEIPRQIEVLKKGGKLIQSTRRWDDVAGVTDEMRTKEHAHDYRYFPDPDLMPFEPSESWLAEVKTRVVELPLARKKQLMRDYGLPSSDAEFFAHQPPMAEAYKHFTGFAPDSMKEDVRLQVYKTMANYMVNIFSGEFNAAGVTVNRFILNQDDLSGFSGRDANGLERQFLIPPSGVYDVAKAQVVDQQISGSAAPTVIKEMLATSESYAVIVEKKGLAQVSDTGAIEKFCDEVIAANPGPANDFKSGKAAALNFLKGQVMKLSKGKANPTVVGEILERKLKA